MNYQDREEIEEYLTALTQFWTAMKRQFRFVHHKGGVPEKRVPHTGILERMY